MTLGPPKRCRNQKSFGSLQTNPQADAWWVVLISYLKNMFSWYTLMFTEQNTFANLRFGFLFTLEDPPPWFGKRPHFFRIFFRHTPLISIVFHKIEKIQIFSQQKLNLLWRGQGFWYNMIKLLLLNRILLKNQFPCLPLDF